jgi:ankyrin repeat protein|tara:strand:+ start:186 stop:803 length:618 start_codon:yes stop_codon:yes gene_type:complete
VPYTYTSVGNNDQKMKIPFLKKIKNTKLTFEKLTELLRSNNLKKLQNEKRNGLDFGITDSYDGKNILEYYIKYQDSFEYDKLEFIEFLIECGIEINHKGNKKADENSALHLSVYIKDLDFIKILLKYNAEIEIQDKYGNTPLLRAVMNYRGETELKDIIMFLIDKGASLEKKNFHDISSKEHIMNIGGGIDAGFNKKEWDLREII